MKWFRKLLIPVLFVCEIHSGGSQSQQDSTLSNSDAKYFISPQEAIKQIDILLREKNWIELTRYYNLSQCSIEKSELESGKFFYTEERPEVAHPAGFWKFRHPFAPGFEFFSESEIEDTNITEVTVSIEIDQGQGMIQRAYKTFLMKKNEKGYQLIPPP